MEGNGKVVKPMRPVMRPPYPQITTRHLIYHVYADKTNELWRANIRQLTRSERWALFNGRKLIAIATDENTRAVFEVIQAFPANCGAKFLRYENDRRLREVATFGDLLRQVRTTDPNAAVFYAHTKGNSNLGGRLPRESLKGMTYWRNTMYHYLLDYPVQVMNRLQQFPAVGACQGSWLPGHISPYPSGLSHGCWMFCGTFFWFRADLIFGNWRWPFIPDDRYGAESWLSGLFDRDEVHSFYQPWDVTCMPPASPYDPQYYQPIEDHVPCESEIK